MLLNDFLAAHAGRSEESLRREWAERAFALYRSQDRAQILTVGPEGLSIGSESGADLNWSTLLPRHGRIERIGSSWALCLEPGAEALRDGLRLSGGRHGLGRVDFLTLPGLELHFVNGASFAARCAHDSSTRRVARVPAPLAG